MAKFFLVLLLLLPTAAICQTFSTSLDVPALTSGPAAPSSGRPVLNFDRRILVEVIGARRAEFYLYINTRTGDFGIMYGRPGELGAGELNINDEKFRFMVMRSGGQVQVYMTQKQNGALKHWVSTGNTEIFPIAFQRPENAVVQRLGIVEPFVREGSNGEGYRANSSGAPTYYLYGGTSHRNLTVQDFLGYSGVGYMKSNRGVHMVLGADMGGTRFHAVSWRDVTTTLDMTPFELIESHMDDKARVALDREESKLRNETYSGDCVTEEEEWRRLRLADVESRRRLNAARRQGNVYESEPARRAQSEMMIPNLEVMNQEIEVKLCKANGRLSRARSEAARADIEQKIQCYRRQQSQLNTLQMEWNAIDARHRDNSGRAYEEKVRTYGRILSIGGECR